METDMDRNPPIILGKFRFSFDKNANSNIEAGRQIGWLLSLFSSIISQKPTFLGILSFLARNTYNYPAGRYFMKVKALRSVTLDTAAIS